MVDLRSLMSTFPTGVGVVTALGPDEQPCGMTCTSIASVALDPPCLLLSLRSASPTLAAVTARGGFALNLLRSDARQVAELFASGSTDRWERVRWSAEPDAEGPHLEDAAHSTADCKLLHRTAIGDHTVVFGHVVRITARGDVRPLMYGLREFARWPDSVLLSPGI